MNLAPVAGDRWTLIVEVLSVKGNVVRIRRGTEIQDMKLAEYLKLAAATVDSGGTLERPETETEEVFFE